MRRAQTTLYWLKYVANLDNTHRYVLSCRSWLCALGRNQVGHRGPRGRARTGAVSGAGQIARMAIASLRAFCKVLTLNTGDRSTRHKPHLVHTAAGPCLVSPT